MAQNDKKSKKNEVNLKLVPNDIQENTDSIECLRDAIAAMEKCKKPRQTKKGEAVLEYERGDIAPIVAWLEHRNVSKDTFSCDSGLKISGETFDEPRMTHEQLLMQKYGLPALGVSGLRLMRQAAEYVGSKNATDGLKNYFDSLPEWDGTSRISTFWQSYCGSIADTAAERAYLKAVAEYMFTAIVGRAYATANTPCKADYCITLVGETGIGKSSLCRALAVKHEYYTEVSTLTPEDEWRRLLRQVHIVEIGEIKECGDAHLQAMKRILSSETVKVRKKGVDDNFFFAVRAFTFATADQTDVLNDPAGNRRFIPVNVRGFIPTHDGQRVMDAKGIDRDKVQLYAEAKALFDASGVMWEQIPQDIRRSHAAEITAQDERAEAIRQWFITTHYIEATLAEIWEKALNGRVTDLDKKRQMELAKALQLAGFKKTLKRGHNGRSIYWSLPMSDLGNDEF